jgi:L-fucose isomerase-like protein
MPIAPGQIAIKPKLSGRYAIAMQNALIGGTTPSERAEKISALDNAGHYARKLFLISVLTCSQYRFFMQCFVTRKLNYQKLTCTIPAHLKQSKTPVSP